MDTNNNEVVYLYLDDIIPNRFQPREVFDDQALKELAVSIREHGVIQPIIVRKVENKYEIIAGERRYKASTMAGLTKIPAIVKNLDDKETSKVALIENLQRKDLSPIEEARTYQKILELENEMTQEQLAATMGKTQSSVSNKLRLLALPDEIQDALLKEKISERHARSLLNVEDKNNQIKLLDKIIAEKMTVRELDKEIKELNNPSTEDSGDGKVLNINDNMNNNQNNFNQMNPTVSDTFNSNVATNLNPPVTSLTDNSTLSNSNVGNSQPSVVSQSVVPSFTANVTPNVEASTTPSVVNPTEVDINKIRENAVDIGAPKEEKPHVDVNELMKDTSNLVSDEKFKFVPSFDFNSFQSKEEATDGFSQLVNSKQNMINEQENKQAESSTNVASSIKPFSFSFGSSSGKDVSTAVNDIKNTVKNLKNSGYDVSIIENDTTDNYQITINLKKNA